MTVEFVMHETDETVPEPWVLQMVLNQTSKAVMVEDVVCLLPGKSIVLEKSDDGTVSIKE